MEMFRSVCFLLVFSLAISVSQARSIIPRPQPLNSLKVNTTQNQRSCSFTVSIRTSCYSTRYTRDQISLAFGDAYGNQVGFNCSKQAESAKAQRQLVMDDCRLYRQQTNAQIQQLQGTIDTLSEENASLLQVIQELQQEEDPEEDPEEEPVEDEHMEVEEFGGVIN